MHYSLTSRAVLVCSAFVAVLTALSVHVIDVQIVQHAQAIASVERKNVELEKFPARRGRILDYKGEVLATSHALTDLKLDKHQLPEPKQIARLLQEVEDRESKDLADAYFHQLARRLARPLQQEEVLLYQRMAEPKAKFPVVVEKLEPSLARQLVAELAEQGFRGLVLEDTCERHYTSGDLAAHVLGFVHKDHHGGAGVEKALDTLLSGVEGNRKTVMGKIVEDKPPRHGSDVVLTLDTTIQTIVERELDRQWELLRPDKITAIFMRPQTGDIIALANRPTFSPATAPHGVEKIVWDNVAISSTFEPGSTFKLIAHGAAMDQRLVRLTTEVDCHGGEYREEKWPKALTDLKQGLGWTPVRDVIAYSLNTGTFEVARKLEPGIYYNYIRSFGFGEKLGLHLTGEENGSVLPLKKFENNRFELSRLAMGYNVAATPLQILGVVNVVANNGSYVKPRIVCRVDSDGGANMDDMPPDIVKGIISEQAAGWLAEALIHCAEVGTAKRAAIPGYVIGGKTGTAEKNKNGGYYSSTDAKERHNVCSFVGFAGTEERIELIAIILVDDPRRVPEDQKEQGGIVAAPIFHTIASQVLFHLGVSPSERLIAASKNPLPGGAE